jgi:tetratricopeptide (TPR) repeat protein
VNDWDLDTCEVEMRRALQLNPSDEHAHAAISIFLIATSDEQARAISEMNLALRVDPLSEYVNACLAWIHLFTDDYDKAVEQARRTLELFPGSPLAYAGLGLAELCRSRYAQAIEIFEKAVAISQDALSTAYLAAAHARAGDLGVATSLLKTLQSRSECETVTPRCFVIVHAAIGEPDQAFYWLDRAYEAHDPYLFFLRVMPLYDPLRSDPRFDEMLRRLGIPRN